MRSKRTDLNIEGTSPKVSKITIQVEHIRIDYGKPRAGFHSALETLPKFGDGTCKKRPGHCAPGNRCDHVA
jgi:hypothetical protein